LAERAKREEFYNLVHENVKAEFIGGEIVFHSPVRAAHWQMVSKLAYRLGAYIKKNNLGELGIEKVLVRFSRNDFEPDIVFFNKEMAATFVPDQKLFPIPDFVVEVLSESTEHNDRGVKYREYALGGVKEYWIVDPEKNVLEQYTNTSQEFALVKAHLGSSTVTSLAIEGFVLDLKDIFGA
jgi:Uma2 family endonuclease